MFEKTLAIILLLTIGATIAKPAADSSQPCTTTGELKQVSDCGGEYYICDNGAWKIMPCPGGLKFSEAHNRCEWDYNVAGCSSTEDTETTTTTATTTTTTTEADSSSSCTTIGELKQDSDCGGDYYICDHGGWTKMSCPAGLKFSEAANQCDWDYNVAGCNTDAAETTTTTAATTTTTEADSSASCTTSGELKQVSDCGGDYYICDHGKWTQMSCPAGLKFSEAANQCDWDYNVAGCNTDAADTTTTTAATTTTTEAESSASCTTSGELKQVSDCGGDYYICDHGEWRQMSCPAGLKFSEAANQCDWDYNVAGCNTDAAETTTTTAATTTTTTEADSSASCATSGELKQVSDCGGDYYICDHGEWTQMSCPAGLKFSEAANQCDWDYNVAGCNTDAAETTTTTAATTTTTTEADSSASCTTSGELKQVSDCGGDYYICDHGKWTQMSCPEGLKFSEAANQCEWDYNVAGCNTDPAETTTTTAVATTTTTTTTEDPDACTHEALIPTDECSGQFIQCVHGEEVIIECPADLIFDVETGRCEYEQDVASCAAITQVKEETVCEHDWMRIKCEDSKKIKVISASFGRSSKDVCRYGLLKDTNCHSSKSDSVVSKKCEGKSRCNVWASIWLFGDPCFLTYKYLQVEYQCV